MALYPRQQGVRWEMYTKGHWPTAKPLSPFAAQWMQLQTKCWRGRGERGIIIYKRMKKRVYGRGGRRVGKEEDERIAILKQSTCQ